MQPDALLTALRTLEGRGWPVQVDPKSGISDAPHVRFCEPRAGHIGALNIRTHKPLPWDAEALVTGWLVKQLEARGYKREVKQHMTFDLCNVLIVRPIPEAGYDVRGRKNWCKTELEALLAACLELEATDDR